MMFWRDTLLSKANVAPDLRKAWPIGDICKVPRIILSAFLMWLSMICENGGCLLAKSGAKGGRGLEERSVFKALTGHNQRLLISGICAM